MGDESRPMPQITVSDPNRPDRPAVLLDRPPLDPAVRRHRLRIAAAVVLGGALAVGAAEWRERRADAAQERRLGSVVELRAEDEGRTASFDPTGRTGELSLRLVLHNDGPRDVHVTTASVAGYDLLPGEVRVAAGGSAPLLLERTVTCDPRIAPTTPQDGLQLGLRTVSGERALSLPLATDTDEAARLCGFRPLESLSVGFGAMGRPAPEVLDLSLDLETRAVRPVRLTAVTPPPGIAVQVQTYGRPRGLPLELPPLDGLTRSLSVMLRFTMHDCAAALAPSGPDLPEGHRRDALPIQLTDDDGRTMEMLVGYPERVLDSLVAESC